MDGIGQGPKTGQQGKENKIPKWQLGKILQDRNERKSGAQLFGFRVGPTCSREIGKSQTFMIFDIFMIFKS